jgi:hypothetical protein
MTTVTVLGIDLAHKSWADCGTAQLAFAPDATGPAGWTAAATNVVPWPESPVSVAAMAAAIDATALEAGAAAVGIDGPQGWRDPAIPREAGVARRCERESRTPGKTGPYGIVYPGGYSRWVAFSIAVFDALLATGRAVLANDPANLALAPLPGRYHLLECFPTSTWRTSGLQRLPGHAKAPPPVVAAFAGRLVERHGLPETALTDHHDHLQAVVAALPAAALLGGPCRPVPRGIPARDLPATDLAPAHRVEGLIWDAAPRDS